MQLIGALASGILGASGGSATLRRRGTSTAATWYSSFEATSSSSTDVALDQNGGATVYVDEPVDVTVRDANGSTVRSFTEGCAATAVEVISPSFTGNDYVTALLAENKPTLLSSVLDRWITSAGASDFNVLIDGAEETIQNALGRSAGIFFNVKSPEFGATGDGVTSDSAAINAALAAAGSGGTVYFPEGTYRVTSTLNASGGQNWVLAPGAVVSSSGFASDLIGVTGGPASSTFRVSGGGFVASGSHTGNIITSTRSIYTEGTSFTGSFSGNGIVVSAGLTVSLSRTGVVLLGSASICIASSAGAYPTVYMDTCTISCQHAAYASHMVRLRAGSIHDSLFTPSFGAGSHSAIRCGATSAGNVQIVNNYFDMPVGVGTSTAIDCSELTSVDTNNITIAGNGYAPLTDVRVSFGSGYCGINNDADLIGIQVTTSATSYVVDTSVYRTVHLIRSGGAGNLDFSAPVASVNGQRLAIVIINATGAIINVGFGSGMASPNGTAARLAVGLGQRMSVEFVNQSGTFYQLGPSLMPI